MNREFQDAGGEVKPGVRREGFPEWFEAFLNDYYGDVSPAHKRKTRGEKAVGELNERFGRDCRAGIGGVLAKEVAAAIDVEIARERDECAKVVEGIDVDMSARTRTALAAAIRARGETPAQGAT